MHIFISKLIIKREIIYKIIIHTKLEKFWVAYSESQQGDLGRIWIRQRAVCQPYFDFTSPKIIRKINKKREREC